MFKDNTKSPFKRSLTLLVPVLAVAVLIAVGMHINSYSNSASVPTTYYVSPTGSDSNNGTSTSTPWKTINEVNSHKYTAGQTIAFQGGSSYSGQIYFAAGESGTSTSPITVTSYGSGKATINGGTVSAIFAYNSAGFNITNLNLVGSGASSSTEPGLRFWNYNDGTLSYINISGVSASGFQSGLSIGATAAGTGYNTVNVLLSSFYNNEDSGVVTYGPTFNPSNPTYAVTNMTVNGVTAYNNTGNPSFTGSTNSGNGVDLGSTNGSTIENSVAYGNGASCKSNACGVGLWGYDSNNLTIKNNISYGNLTGSAADGDGFDLDQNTSNSVMEYNYSYNNQGAGYLVFGESTNQSHTSNTVRFNVSQNDGRKNSYGGIMLYGNVSKDNVYNNTVYMTTASTGKPFPLEIYTLGSGQSTVRNNIFYAAGNLTPAYVSYSPTTAGLEMQGNDYYPFGVYWKSTNYTSLASFQSATGQEKLGTTSVGFSSNPGLNAAGTGSALTDPSTLHSLSQYQLASGSPMKNAGINLTSQFGTNLGGFDFFGVAVPTASGISVGAAE